MADVDDDGPDFDVDLGDTGSKADKSAGKAGADEVDDELEDLSREELYDRLKEANGTAKKYRLRLKRARSGAGRTSDRDDEDDDRRSARSGRDDRGTRDAGRRRDDRDDDREDDDDRRPARRSSRDADRWQEEAIAARAEVALAQAGIPADRLARAVRLIDLAALELDGRDLLGIDEEIEDLKDEWPELFEKRRRSSRDDDDDDRDTRRDSGTRRRVSRADTRAGGGTGGRDRGNKKKTSTEIAAEQLMGLANR